MSGHSINRRHFMKGSGAAAGTALARVSWAPLLAVAQTACTARDQDKGFKLLSVEEARELEAIAARILPTTDTPGAREAGVVYFFDNVTGTEVAGLLDGILGELPAFQSGIGERFRGAQRFSDLDEADQDAWIADHENGGFFGMTWALTIMGFFAMSSWGGNRDNIAWDLIGFEGPGPAQHPFGYYDAEYLREHHDGN